MDFGFYLPDSGSLATPEVISRLSGAAEDMGYGILAVSDHIVMPTGIDSVYPYEEDGEWPGGMDCLEVLTTLSFIAGQTTKARLLSSVLVLPYRPPVFTAKILATVDVLSKGRLILGLGVGWMKEEFQALGSPPFEERGAVSDEYIEIFKSLWTQSNPAMDGNYAQFSNVDFQPKPVQKPYPPLWVGGESGPALRRTARIGDVWYPISSNPRFPVVTVEQLTHSMTRIRQYAEGFGRDPNAIGIAYNPSFYSPGQVEKDGAGERVPFTGAYPLIADDVKRFEAAGVKDLILGFSGDTVDEWLLAMDAFMDKVVSR